jgi:uncharacterized protein YjbJ (UPF0337 family)
MNWEEVKGKWTELRGHAIKQWGKLTEDDLDQIEGDRAKLVGRLQQAYGYQKEAAEKEAESWAKGLKA